MSSKVRAIREMAWMQRFEAAGPEERLQMVDEKKRQDSLAQGFALIKKTKGEAAARAWLGTQKQQAETAGKPEDDREQTPPIDLDNL